MIRITTAEGLIFDTRGVKSIEALKVASGSTPPAAGVFPNYGNAKGQPIAGADRKDLEYYAAGCRRTLEDSSKERFHPKERATLTAIEAELAKYAPPDEPAF